MAPSTDGLTSLMMCSDETGAVRRIEPAKLPDGTFKFRGGTFSLDQAEDFSELEVTDERAGEHAYCASLLLVVLLKRHFLGEAGDGVPIESFR